MHTQPLCGAATVGTWIKSWYMFIQMTTAGSNDCRSTRNLNLEEKNASKWAGDRTLQFMRRNEKGGTQVQTWQNRKQDHMFTMTAAVLMTLWLCTSTNPGLLSAQSPRLHASVISKIHSLPPTNGPVPNTTQKSRQYPKRGRGGSISCATRCTAKGLGKQKFPEWHQPFAVHSALLEGQKLPWITSLYNGNKWHRQRTTVAVNRFWQILTLCSNQCLTWRSKIIYTHFTQVHIQIKDQFPPKTGLRVGARCTTYKQY